MASLPQNLKIPKTFKMKWYVVDLPLYLTISDTFYFLYLATGKKISQTKSFPKFIL